MLAIRAPAHPATPVKTIRGDGPVERVFRQLNDDYDLGLELPDPSLTPSRRKQLGTQNKAFANSDQISRGIGFLYWQKDDSLDEALVAFFNTAKVESLRWVPKPRADPGTLPSSAIPPKARTANEQESLRAILIATLDRFKADKINKKLFPRPNGHRAAAPLAGPPTLSLHAADDSDAGSLSTSPVSAGSKRSFEFQADDNDHVSKRSRGSEPFSPAYTSYASGSALNLATALDGVPTRQHAGPIRSLGAKSPSILDRRPHGVNQEGTLSSRSSETSSTNVSSIFSRRGGHSSQSTAAVSFREKRDAPALAPPSNALASTESLQDAAHESPTWYSPSSTHSDFSDLSDDLMPVAPHPPTPARRDALQAPVIRTPVKGHTAIQSRLQDLWPKFPAWLHNAPLAVAWEVTRICLNCNVDADSVGLQYNPTWASDMDGIWRALKRLDLFRGKSFPERPSAEVFSAALAGFESKGNTVLMSASLEFNPSKTGPLFLLDMKPLRLDEGCRLTRRFGPDRFLEILIPAPTSSNAPPMVKELGGADQIIRWLTEKPHSLVGRQWQAFFAKDAGYRKPAKEFRLGPDAQASFKERVHFFAENGHTFRPAVFRTRDIPAANERTELKASQMLDWLLQLDQNGSQPHLKLFSRIQLGLSKTIPAVAFEVDQLRHHREDILSPIGKTMNDGIGLMSRSVARKVRDALGLIDIPSAIQGRMGSAKGMWLMDVADTGTEDWIDTYPSQRKWNCNWADPYHRTLEVRSVSSELKSAGLNLQFLPVLEARAKDMGLMRQAIGARLTNDLERQFEDQKAAFKCPLQFRQFANENWSGRSDRVKYGQVPFLGGLPENKGEILNFLLNSGFDPRKQKYVQDLAWELQKQRCDILKTKLNIKVGRSAYIYMVIDFWGVLEENEVHLGFSSKFRAESEADASYTLLADCDVLVARSPAHFVSDVQRVRAVFKSELHALKDVIVFSAKGDIPLADKLSGGDYDGDMAWVCWDPDIVNSFVNADMPKEPDLSAYMEKDKTTFADLVRYAGQPGDDLENGQIGAQDTAVYEMIRKSFQFTMQPNFLGICTNYKEKICYHNNSVSNNDAVILSTLVGKLVDQSKQGIIFDKASWDRLRRDHFKGRMQPEDPAYKRDGWMGAGNPRHIIDYLKFAIAKPAIDRELEAFHKAMQGKGRDDEDAAHHWDKELVVYYDAFKQLATDSRSLRAVLESLNNAIGAVEGEWKVMMRSRDQNVAYPEKVRQLYAKWCDIAPRAIGRNGSNRLDPKTAALLEPPADMRNKATCYWALLKASTAFKAYYRSNPRFVWQMAGRQLAFIKAQMAGGPEEPQAPLLVAPLMYAGLLPDGKFVKQYLARTAGDGSEFLEDGESGEDGEGGTLRGDDVD
ncbi:hypothetical protein BT67DRAFT_419358 [Trichocladium antarcticum]|uniref:RNA-dependent RNA polymerase n=1 Tax=Trichocladium antarcticum TaxID=1450529 RepID=A0AAN6ULF9_9PEZI|nr:hypothetical protein BT67DRAFT_419358 [Trichocladium antarcticum]